jgi:hypothetical protein
MRQNAWAVACALAWLTGCGGDDSGAKGGPHNQESACAVTYSSDAVAFILGPQLQAGCDDNPWPWFDENALDKGLLHGEEFPATPSGDPDLYLNLNYYDQGLVQYLNYHRSGDARYLDIARKIADSWWLHGSIGEGATSVEESMAPRNISLGGLMLRALDGRPEMWPWITEYTRFMFDVWVFKRTTYDSLYYGVRDGGYMLLYAAWLVAAHPEATVRDEFREKVLVAAKDYYARLQYPDGSWRWIDEGVSGVFMQPFMIGLLLDGMIAVHRLTGDVAVGDAIVASVKNLFAKGYRGAEIVPELPERSWRGMWYFVYADGCDPGCGSTNLDGGWDTNTIREVRQMNAPTLHAWGYAHAITGDATLRDQGDEVFAATFGRDLGPLADPSYGLADFRAKEYNQSYRSAGRYLAWRLAH